jgi:hypothetical protein
MRLETDAARRCRGGAAMVALDAADGDDTVAASRNSLVAGGWWVWGGEEGYRDSHRGNAARPGAWAGQGGGGRCSFDHHTAHLCKEKLQFSDLVS